MNINWQEAIRAAQRLATDDPAIRQALQTDPVAGLEQVAASPAFSRAEPAYVRDKFIYRIVVSVLGLTVLLTVAGGLAICALSPASGPAREIPASLIALGSGALGALAGLLAPSPAQASTSP